MPTSADHTSARMPMRHAEACFTWLRYTASSVVQMRFLLVLFTSAAALAQPATEVEAVVSTELGTFRFEFAPDKAPKHVEQFLARARQGYYDGSAFFRAVTNGIIQGGDPTL